jgi:cell division protein FtsW
MPRDPGFLAALPRLSSIAAAPRESRALTAYDATLAWSALILLALGLVMVYSASIATAEALAYTGYRPWYFLVRHAAFVAIGLAAALFAFQIPLKIWQKLAPYLFIAGAALLVAVLIPGIGKSVNGSKRWLSLYIVNLQPGADEARRRPYAASYAVRRAAFLPPSSR